MRMFDHDLAQRVERQLGLGHSRSVSMLVAPAIAAAVANRRTQTTVPAGRRVLLMTEVTVERDSVAVGRRLGELDETGGLRVLARQDQDGWDWQPAFGRAAQAGHPAGRRRDPQWAGQAVAGHPRSTPFGPVGEDGPMNRMYVTDCRPEASGEPAELLPTRSDRPVVPA